MKRGFGFFFGLLALPVTVYFVYALSESLSGDHEGGDALIVQVLTGLAAVIAASLWTTSAVLLRRASRDENRTAGPDNGSQPLTQRSFGIGAVASILVLLVVVLAVSTTWWLAVLVAVVALAGALITAAQRRKTKNLAPSD
jgi:Flp pilus assembly protein TadB